MFHCLKLIIAIQEFLVDANVELIDSDVKLSLYCIVKHYVVILKEQVL